MLELPLVAKYFKLYKANSPKIVFIYTILSWLILLIFSIAISVVIVGLLFILFAIYFAFTPVSETYAIFLSTAYISLLGFITQMGIKHYLLYKKHCKEILNNVKIFLKKGCIRKMIYNNPDRSAITKIDLENLNISKLGTIDGFKFNMLLRGLENENRDQKRLQELYENIIYS